MLILLSIINQLIIKKIIFTIRIFFLFLNKSHQINHGTQLNYNRKSKSWKVIHFIKKIIKNSFSKKYKPTFWTLVKKTIDINNIPINLNFPDICYQEHYQSIRKNSCINKDIIIIIFDINQMVSFYNVLYNKFILIFYILKKFISFNFQLIKYIQIIYQYTLIMKPRETCQLKNIKKIIIANKIDLRENDEQIEDYKYQIDNLLAQGQRIKGS
ncbi:unnamed protein product [Paramecium sonneborni]|uniref:Uncharacterized protein n=1 Tax=Paramecium sonneborni TaxID=65129 RepID=A0A8S1RQK7_9CILI|nr:unnamed protein product [Paramecium sonneborni]